MFSSADATVHKRADSFEKLDAIGDTYFPQLGALLLKANELIYAIYGVQSHQHYKISQTPISSKGRREGVKFVAKKNEASQANVGLRALGKPSSLLKANSSPSDMHFALLAFAICDGGNGPMLTVGFEPYILKYHQQCRDKFAELIHELELERNLELRPCSYFPMAGSLSELARRPKILVLGDQCPGVDPDNTLLAALVITFVGMFPLLDVFTRLSNGDDPRAIDYTQRFHDWVVTKSQAYIQDFHIEPIKDEVVLVSEALVRSQFESLFNRSFPKTKPAWLKKAGSKSSLELDGYCEELNLAFEYQGEYHYIYVPVHHQGRSLEEVQKNDALKLQICTQRGISLIQVPYWQRGNLAFIIEALEMLQRPDIAQLVMLAKPEASLSPSVSQW